MLLNMGKRYGGREAMHLNMTKGYRVSNAPEPDRGV
jgi:hypothetical protein